MRPLIIQSFGSKLAVKDGLFEVTVIENNKYEKYEYATTEIQSIWIQNGCSITTAAITLAMEAQIDLQLLNGLGVPIGRWMPSKPNSIVTIQRAQLQAANTKEGVAYVKTWIAEKLANQSQLLEKRNAHHRRRESTQINAYSQQILQCRTKILALEAAAVHEIAPTLRGLEGAAGRAYFQGLSLLLPERYQFELRNRFPATDAFNSALNYAYAILYTKVEAALHKAGLNPYAGLMHADGSLQLSMVYDFVEPFRVMVEEPILNLFIAKTMNQAHFEQSEGEKLWLAKSGKSLIINTLQHFFKEKEIVVETLNYQREQLILRCAHRFAQSLLATQKLNLLEVQQN